MANGKFASVGTELNIPTYLPLPKAARKYGLSEKVLTQLVKAGKIEAVQLPSGQASKDYAGPGSLERSRKRKPHRR